MVSVQAEEMVSNGTETPPTFELEQVSRCPLCESRKGVFVGRCRDNRFGYPGEFEVMRCEVCDLSYLRVRIKEASLQELYSNYYKTAPCARSPNPLTAVVKRALRPFYPDTVFRPDCVDHSSILEIGPGGRPLPDRLAHRFGSYYAIEFDQKAVGGLRTRFGANNVFSNLRQALDSTDRAPVTCCVADQVLEHMYHPIAFLGEIKALVGPGATVILSTPNTDSRYLKARKMNWVGWHVPYHVALHSPRSITFLAKACGLKVTVLRSWTPGSWLRFQKMAVEETWTLVDLAAARLQDQSPFRSNMDGDVLYCCLQKA
jgi:2-polyprenyl-3-methyl-5-hydroxy-6-metoxy-1,4-benzoquinol methylase